MNIGCFALVHPFSTLDAQLSELTRLGFKHADITDNSDGDNTLDVSSEEAVIKSRDYPTSL